MIFIGWAGCFHLDQRCWLESILESTRDIEAGVGKKLEEANNVVGSTR
jgi:hypothetical protein